MPAGSSFGLLFRVTSFGESHGKCIGVVVDGVPAGLPLSERDVYKELLLRRPGHRWATQRREPDRPEILSGVFNGRTTGAPVAIIVWNRDVDSRPYEEVRCKPRPGHADLAYIEKYGWENWDYRGGGRASGRETVARVAAGAIAKKLLLAAGIRVYGRLAEIGGVELVDPASEPSEEELRAARHSPLRVHDPSLEERVAGMIEEARRQGDSLGGVVEAVAFGVPPGLGDPVFDKLKADLAKAAMSIPAAVGFEVGLGFRLARMRGSEARDPIRKAGGRVIPVGPAHGGMLGGISVGTPIRIRVAFKPTSSIPRPIETWNVCKDKPDVIRVKGRHDPALVVRAVAVVEAMMAVVLADHALRNGLIPANRLGEEHVERIERLWEEAYPCPRWASDCNI